ncbi:MAG TPA: TIGR03086 family metal-binding protein [Acidimicrobiales bacterium]
MTSELPDAHARALLQTGRFVAGVGPDQWHDPTPCGDWDVRALVNHVVAGNFWVAPLFAGRTIEEVGTRYDGDILGDDPVDAYQRSADEARAAVLAEGAMEAPCAVSYGPVPGEIYAGHRLLDVVVHGWDIATATGQDALVDPDLVAVCWAVVEPQLPLLAASGMFGSPVEVATDASTGERLLAALGRHP